MSIQIDSFLVKYSGRSDDLNTAVHGDLRAGDVSGCVGREVDQGAVQIPFAAGAAGGGDLVVPLLHMWIMGSVGFAGSLLAFILSFIPPSQIQTGSNAVWYSVLVVGCIIMVVIPFVIYGMRKPSWRDPNAEFAPFHWEGGNSGKS